ncbi:MAG: Hpt domain-containing protein [Pseudomonadota bacterium]
MTTDTETAQIINAPNRLKAKLGGHFKSFNAEAIARAEEALAGMSGQFSAWMDEEIAKLEAAHKIILEPTSGEKELESFYRHAHDLKGLGATYGFPIISQFAGSLCRLIDSPDGRSKAPKSLLSAHVSSIVAAVHQNVKDASHPIGNALLRELTAQVAKYGAPV